MISEQMNRIIPRIGLLIPPRWSWASAGDRVVLVHGMPGVAGRQDGRG